MVKFVVMIEPKEGTDLEEFWKRWQEVHAPIHDKPQLKKYVINRVTQVIAGGEIKVWGMTEQWFDSMESYQEYRRANDADPEFQRLNDDWHGRLAGRTIFFMEEKVLIDR